MPDETGFADWPGGAARGGLWVGPRDDAAFGIGRGPARASEAAGPPRSSGAPASCQRFRRSRRAKG